MRSRWLAPTITTFACAMRSTANNPEARFGDKAGVADSNVRGDGKIYCASEIGTVSVLEPDPELRILAEIRWAALVGRSQ